VEVLSTGTVEGDASLPLLDALLIESGQAIRFQRALYSDAWALTLYVFDTTRRLWSPSPQYTILYGLIPNTQLRDGTIGAAALAVDHATCILSTYRGTTYIVQSVGGVLTVCEAQFPSIAATIVSGVVVLVDPNRQVGKDCVFGELQRFAAEDRFVSWDIWRKVDDAPRGRRGHN